MAHLIVRSLAFVLVTTLCVLASDEETVGNGRERPSTVGIHLDAAFLANRTQTIETSQARRNAVEIVRSTMSAAMANGGRDRLQFLLDYNTPNEQLLREMNLHFQKHGEYEWHLALADVFAGAVPSVYAYYRFDRQNTVLFVGGYPRC